MDFKRTSYIFCTKTNIFKPLYIHSLISLLKKRCQGYADNLNLIVRFRFLLGNEKQKVCVFYAKVAP